MIQKPSCKCSVLLILITLLLFFNASLAAEDLITITTHDGLELVGKLDLPDQKPIPAVVLFVHGSGPNTYQNHRSYGEIEFNYFDLFAQEFNKRGIAFFRYNTRGTKIGNNPPYYDQVDRDLYQTNLPLNQVRDIEAVLRYLKTLEPLAEAKVYLLGWSEGTILAPMVVERGKVEVDALLLAGYVHDNLFEAIRWQNSGASSMLFYKKYFDQDGDGIISSEEYEKDPYQIIPTVFNGAKFAEIDQNGDNILTNDDFKILLQPRLTRLLAAIDNGEDDWIWNNYFRATSAWFKAHFELEPNHKRLLKLALPIYIFHGEDDQHVPVEGALEIEKKFENQGKENINVYVFKGHDHDLNYTTWPLQGEISAGLKAIFATAEKLSH